MASTFEKVRELLNFLESYSKSSSSIENYFELELQPLEKRLQIVETSSNITIEKIQEASERLHTLQQETAKFNNKENETLKAIHESLRNLGTIPENTDVDKIIETLRSKEDTKESLTTAVDTELLGKDVDSVQWKRVSDVAKEQLQIVKDIQREGSEVDTSLTDEGGDEDQNSSKFMDMFNNFAKSIKGSSIVDTIVDVGASVAVPVIEAVKQHNKKVEKEEDAKTAEAQHFAPQESLQIMLGGFNPDKSYVNDKNYINERRIPYVEQFSKNAAGGLDLESLKKMNKGFNPDMKTLEGAQAYVAKYFAAKNRRNKKKTRTTSNEFYQKDPKQPIPLVVQNKTPEDIKQGYIPDVNQSKKEKKPKQKKEKPQEKDTKLVEMQTPQQPASTTSVVSSQIVYKITNQPGGITE